MRSDGVRRWWRWGGAQTKTGKERREVIPWQRRQFGTNNILTKILVKCTDVIPDTICWSTTCKPFFKVLEMGLVSQMIDNTCELVVDIGIGLKDMFNLKITIGVIRMCTYYNKKTYQHCHKTYHLQKYLLELTPSHSHPGHCPFGYLDEVLNQLPKSCCMEAALSCLYTK